MNAHLNEVQRGREGMEPEEIERLLQKILQDFRTTSPLHSGLNYDQILKYLRSAKKEDRIGKYKALLKFRNIPYEADVFTWYNEDL